MPNSPAPRIALTPVTQALDVQVVAGKSYVFAACTVSVAIYKWEPIKPKGEHLVLVKTLDLQKIFLPLFGPDDPAHPRPHNVNVALASAFNWRPNPDDPTRIGVIPCYVEDPFDWRGRLYNGNNLYESGPDGQPASPPKIWTDQNPVLLGGQPHSRYLPTTSCICEAPYDLRLAYDETRDVYFIAGAARNHIWRNAAGYPSNPKAIVNPDNTHHPAVAAQAKRYVFLAVSRPGADPTLETSYDAVPVSEEYGDWPLIGVHGDNVLVTHAEGGALSYSTFYGPGGLAEGGIYGKFEKSWDGQTMGSDAILPVRDHSPVLPDGRAPVFCIGASATDNTRMVVNAVFSPVGLIKGSATVSLGFPWVDPHTTDAVFYGGVIHVLTTGADGVLRYFAVRADFDSAKNTLTVPQSPIRPPLTIQDPDDPNTVSLDSPGVEMTTNGDIVISYRAAGARANGSPVYLETRYQVLYHNELVFRNYAVLKAADPGSTLATLANIDFAKGWLDHDGVTVWIAGSYGSGGSNQKAVIGAVKP